ncbi:MAG TPA: hypothetical protein VFS44_02725, partial [Gemmatimonadaceae bacterium]|nr:hypothetical protein [Gemmatimonadaceae bacterium]
MRLSLPRAGALAPRARFIGRCARLLTRVLLAAALAYAPRLPAQSWRTLTASKQLRGADSLHVRVTYGAGTLTLGSAPTGLLYDVHMRYDADRFRPAQHWDAAARTLVVGADSATQRGFSLDPRSVHLSGDPKAERASALTLGLAPGVPLDLALELGAAEARVDLTGLTVAKLRAVAAAADSRL